MKTHDAGVRCRKSITSHYSKNQKIPLKNPDPSRLLKNQTRDQPRPYSTSEPSTWCNCPQHLSLPASSHPVHCSHLSHLSGPGGMRLFSPTRWRRVGSQQRPRAARIRLAFRRSSRQLGERQESAVGSVNPTKACSTKGCKNGATTIDGGYLPQKTKPELGTCKRHVTGERLRPTAVCRWRKGRCGSGSVCEGKQLPLCVSSAAQATGKSRAQDSTVTCRSTGQCWHQQLSRQQERQAGGRSGTRLRKCWRELSSGDSVWAGGYHVPIPDQRTWL